MKKLMLWSNPFNRSEMGTNLFGFLICALFSASNLFAVEGHREIQNSSKVPVESAVTRAEKRRLVLTKPMQFGWSKVVRHILEHAKKEPSVDFESALSKMIFNLKLLKEIEETYGSEQARGSMADIFDQHRTDYDRMFDYEKVQKPESLHEFALLTTIANVEGGPTSADQRSLFRYVIKNHQYKKDIDGKFRLRPNLDQILSDLIRRKPKYAGEFESDQIDLRVVLILHGFRNLTFTSRAELVRAREWLDQVTWKDPVPTSELYTAQEHDKVIKWYKDTFFRIKELELIDFISDKTLQETLRKFPHAIVLQQILKDQRLTPGSAYFAVQLKRFPESKTHLFNSVVQQFVDLGLIKNAAEALATEGFDIYVTNKEQARFILRLLEGSAIESFESNGNESNGGN